MTGFPVDLMHTGHAGALRQGLHLLFGIDMSKHGDGVLHKFSARQVEMIDDILMIWKQCFPREFNRRPRPLDLLSKWKMRECYVTGARCIPALLAVEEHEDEKGETVDFVGSMSGLQKKYFDNFMYLVLALRIVSSNKMRPIPRVSIYCQSDIQILTSSGSRLI